MILQPSDNPNIEAEGKEKILTASGILATISGKSHAAGGVPIQAQEGDKLFSQKIKLPKTIVAEILNKKVSQVSKMSPAELAGKYPTDKHIDTLNDDKKDQFAKNTAEINLNKNLATLETIFQAQEKFKQSKGIETGKMMTGAQEEQVAQVGGVYGRYKRQPLFELPNLKPKPFDNGIYQRDSQAQYSMVSTPNGLGYYDEFNNFIRVADNPNPNEPYNPLANPYGVVNLGDKVGLQSNKIWDTQNTVGYGSRDVNANSKAYAELTGYDLSTNSYLSGDKERAFNRANIFDPSISKKFSSYNSTYIPTIVDKSGKPVARMYQGEYRKDVGYGDVPIMDQDALKKLLDENPDYTVQFPPTKLDPTANVNNAFATGKNAKVNWDDSQKFTLTGSTTTQYDKPKSLAPVSFDINSLPGYTEAEKAAAVSTSLGNPDVNLGETSQPDQIRLRELEQLDRARFANAADLITQKKQVPYLANVTRVPAYQRYLPMNTLAAERAQSLQNKTLSQSNASSQLSQSVNADTYAKFLDAQDKVNMGNAQTALNVNNQNSQVFSETYNANVLNNAQAMAQYVRESQQVEDQFDYERDRLLANDRELALNKSRIEDRADQEAILAKQMGDPYLPSSIIRRKGIIPSYYRTTEFNPNNRYNNPDKFGWLKANAEREVTLEMIQNEPDKDKRDNLTAIYNAQIVAKSKQK